MSDKVKYVKKKRRGRKLVEKKKPVVHNGKMSLCCVGKTAIVGKKCLRTLTQNVASEIICIHFVT